MNRIVGIALFVFLIFPYLGLFSWLHYQKKLVRKEVKRKLIAGIKKEELTYLKFSKEEAKTKLEWEHSKEFRFNHQMYDIVETKSTKDSVFYYCWWDNEETVLSKKLDTLLAEFLGNNFEKKEKCKSLVSFFKSLYYEDIPDFKITFSIRTISYKEVSFSYISPFISSYWSPPETA